MSTDNTTPLATSGAPTGNFALTDGDGNQIGESQFDIEEAAEALTTSDNPTNPGWYYLSAFGWYGAFSSKPEAEIAGARFGFTRIKEVTDTSRHLALIAATFTITDLTEPRMLKRLARHGLKPRDLLPPSHPDDAGADDLIIVIADKHDPARGVWFPLDEIGGICAEDVADYELIVCSGCRYIKHRVVSAERLAELIPTVKRAGRYIDLRGEPSPDVIFSGPLGSFRVIRFLGNITSTTRARVEVIALTLAGYQSGYRCDEECEISLAGMTERDQ